jgi:hypothetical protein
MKSLLVAAAVAMVLTGCGRSGTASGPTPSPEPTPSAGVGVHFDVVVTEKDKAATIHVGQTLEVVLHANTGMNNWAQVRSTDQSILTPIVNPAATAVRGVTLAAFKAMAPGEADVTAYASPNCPSGQACPMYVQVFSARVTVVP